MRQLETVTGWQLRDVSKTDTRSYQR
jgi:hypothetical protein